MRLRLVIVCAVAALLGAAAARGGAPPPGATARCADGTYSTSTHHAGTCSHHGGVAAWLDGGGAGTSRPSLGTTVLLAPRTRTAGCRLGSLPDRRCSPGAYSTGLTTAVLCSQRFRTSTVRDVPESEKHAVEVEYGLAPRSYGATLEIDHIVSLELGGSNAIGNLFPERAFVGGGAGYRVKDRLENRLHALVCAGRIGLRAAQRQIAVDWQVLYRRVFGAPPEGP